MLGIPTDSFLKWYKHSGVEWTKEPVLLSNIGNY